MEMVDGAIKTYPNTDVHTSPIIAFPERCHEISQLWLTMFRWTSNHSQIMASRFYQSHPNFPMTGAAYSDYSYQITRSVSEGFWKSTMGLWRQRNYHYQCIGNATQAQENLTYCGSRIYYAAVQAPAVPDCHHPIFYLFVRSLSK